MNRWNSELLLAACPVAVKNLQGADEHVHLADDTVYWSSCLVHQHLTPSESAGQARPVFCDTLKPNWFLGAHFVTLGTFMKLSSNQASTPDESPLDVSSALTAFPARTLCCPVHILYTLTRSAGSLIVSPRPEADLIGQTSSPCVVSLVPTPTSKQTFTTSPVTAMSVEENAVWRSVEPQAPTSAATHAQMQTRFCQSAASDKLHGKTRPTSLQLCAGFTGSPSSPSQLPDDDESTRPSEETTIVHLGKFSPQSVHLACRRTLPHNTQQHTAPLMTTWAPQRVGRGESRDPMRPESCFCVAIVGPRTRGGNK